MSAPQPLTGTDLIDCARANAKQGLEMTAKLCGYDHQLDKFEQALKQACHQIGIEIETLGDLNRDSVSRTLTQGVEFAPETLSNL